ncbi:MAG: hypothetical protein RIQ54_240 [Candidatus Parcubacteria bacterium]|jgi:hypothetical protein
MNGKKQKVVISWEYYKSIRHKSMSAVLEEVKKLIPDDNSDNLGEKIPQVFTWNRHLSEVPHYEKVRYHEPDRNTLLKAIPEKGNGFGEVLQTSDGKIYIILEYREYETIYIVVPEEWFEVTGAPDLDREEIFTAHC